MICILDYGVGNVQAFLNLFKRLGLQSRRANTPDSLSDATHLILPGVGHFDYAMNSLNNSGMRDKLDDLVLVNKVPVIGICVGMQMLAESSDEGTLPGLGGFQVVFGHLQVFRKQNFLCLIWDGIV